MNELEYLEKCKRTLSTKDDLLQHMIIGCVTEVGELTDAYKKHKFYGRELNTQNIKEEIGDLCWYLYQLCEVVGYTMEEARADNIEKLAKRYHNKFEDVVIRDVSKELEHIAND